MIQKRFLAGVILCVSAFSLGAAPLTITNPGFEANFVADGQFDVSVIPFGWSVYDPGSILGENYNDVGVLNPTGTALYIGPVPEGDNVAITFLWPLDNDSSDAGLSQTLSGTLQPDTQYTLTVEVGNIAHIMNPPYNLNGFPGYQVQLLADNVVLAMDNDTLNPAEGTFELSTVQFTTGSTHPQLGMNLGIRLINLNNLDSGIEVNFDDVRLDATAVPEPSAGIITSLGLAMFATMRRRNRVSATAYNPRIR